MALSYRHLSTTSAKLLFLAGVLLPSCADPEGAYEDFKDRHDIANGQFDASAGDASDGAALDDGTVPEASGCVMPTAEDLQDKFLFALSANIAKTIPILCLGTLTVSQGAAGAEISFSLQPLDAKDKKTPVGNPIAGGPFPIQADGSFVGDFGTIEVVGAANPISGSDLSTTAVLTGAPGGFCKPADFICGDIAGNLTKPFALDLKGSKFTFQRITDPNAYPVAKIDCEGTPAKSP